jgi:tetratricopeptide (TPR) repeat protein
MRNRIISGGLFPKTTTSRFNDASLERVRQRLKNILIDNSLDRAQMALQHSIQATLNHLDFLKRFQIEDPAQRSAIARVYNHCAYLLSREGRLEEARPLLEQSLAFDPDLVEAVTNFELIQSATSGLGQALRLLSHHKEKDALEMLQKILQQTPQDSDAKELYTTLLHKISHDACRSGEYEEAFSYLSLGCEFRDDYKNELELVLRLKQKNILLKVSQYIQNEEYEQATRILRDYIKSYPDQIQAKKLLAHILNQVAILKNRQRLWTEARECLKEALYLDPENETLKSNLARVDKAAENQQIANDLSQASRLIQESRSKEAIDLLQPLYTGQYLPPPIRDEIRRLLGSAYSQKGMAMMREAENAASQGAVRDLLFSAHLSLVIADFLHPLDTVKSHIAMLEQTLPDLVDQQYDSTVFPQAPGARRHAVTRSRLSRFRKKMKIRIRMGFDLLPRILSTTHFIPFFLIPLAGACVLLVSLLGGTIASALLLALFIQGAVSLYFIAEIKTEKKTVLLLLSVFACILVFGNLAWIVFLKGKMPDFAGLFRFFAKPATPTQIVAPPPSKTPKHPEKTPIPVITPVPGKSTGPGFFAPIWDLSGKIFQEKKPASTISQIPPVKPTGSKPAPVPSPTAGPTPSLTGKTIELSFIIQQFIGIRQKPTPAFMYEITTQGGVGTLLFDPLVYIKISKDKLEQKGWQKARVKVITEGEINVYSIESPSDFSL